MTDDFLSDEDKALFRHHMRSVKPLNEKTKRVKSPTQPTHEKKPQLSRVSRYPKKNIFYLILFVTLFNPILFYLFQNQAFPIRDSVH